MEAGLGLCPLSSSEDQDEERDGGDHRQQDGGKPIDNQGGTARPDKGRLPPRPGNGRSDRGRHCHSGDRYRCDRCHSVEAAAAEKEGGAGNRG